MDEDDDYPPSVYTFSVVSKLKPQVTKVLVSSSLLSSCYGLSLFPESTKIGHIQCKITISNTTSSLQVASLYYTNSVLYINSNEKLRQEFSLHLAEYLITEKWVLGEVIVLDTICENEFVGSLSDRLRVLKSKRALNDPYPALDPGNSIKGFSAAVVIASGFHGINAVCFIGITYSYELCHENLQVFYPLSAQLNLESNIPSGISRIEQERYKHQVYS
jgi:hypothetical protein